MLMRLQSTTPIVKDPRMALFAAIRPLLPQGPRSWSVHQTPLSAEALARSISRQKNGYPVFAHDRYL